MKVCYFITTAGHGRGGHFYSLKSTAEAILTKTDTFIINIGVNSSPVLESSNVKVYNINFNCFNFVKVLKEVLKIIKFEKPTVLHSFDYNAFLFTRLIGGYTKTPYLLTKCGGPNPHYYPIVKDLVLYSNENLDYFKNDKRYSNSSMYLIPNRIFEVNSDTNRIKSIKEQIGNKKILLQIARITEYYEESLSQTINLFNDLNKEHDNLACVIVGIVQSEKVLQKLKTLDKNNKVLFLTTDYYTINASELIDCADFVIGTGRGFMEASSKGKIMLAPVKNKRIPLLVNKSNFEKLFSLNFSLRAEVNTFNEKNILKSMDELLSNEDKSNQISSYNKKNFNDYFNINTVLDKYLNIYENLKIDKQYFIIDIFRNFFITSKAFIKAKRNIK